MSSSSLRSTLWASKRFLSRQNFGKRLRNPIAIAVSCRATKTSEFCNETSTTKYNFYEVLSLNPKNASFDQVKRAYRAMALRYHPEVCGHGNDPAMKAQATRVFVQLHAAYKTLSDPILRENYDCQLQTFSRQSSQDQDSKRKRWEEQIVELKKRSMNRTAQKDGSWGNRMRARNKR